MTTALTDHQRDRLAEHMPMLVGIAAKAAKRFRGSVTFGEALSSASWGAFKAAASYREDGGVGLSTHIHRRASGQVIDDARSTSGYCRATGRRRMFTVGESTRFDRPFHDDGPRRLDERDAAEALIRSVTDDERTRNILRWRVFDELTNREIADRLGVSEALIIRILWQLRKRVAGKEAA